MSESSLLARWFLVGGGALAVISMLLWFALPISMSFPPYLTTALIALAYGAFCLKRSFSDGGKKP